MISKEENEKSPVNRRSFLKNAGTATAAVAAMGLAAPKNLLAAPVPGTPPSPDTPAEIFTAALVAEDLAVTFYYNGLIGGVIQDVNLAGPGGTALDITASGSVSNVGYLRAAFYEEKAHSYLFRQLLGRANYSYADDPYQTFYLPTGTFDSLTPFITVLEALENAFIAAYMAAVQEFTLMAAQATPMKIGNWTYYPWDFAYYAGLAASILGVESEHRALGRAIVPTLIPANQLNYEQQNGIFTVYNGATSAVAALTPFLSPGSGLTAYSLAPAFTNTDLALTATGSIPTVYFK